MRTLLGPSGALLKHVILRNLHALDMRAVVELPQRINSTCPLGPLFHARFANDEADHSCAIDLGLAKGQVHCLH